MAEICRIAKGTILITVPRVPLIEQTVEKLKLAVDDIGVYCASLGRKELDCRFVVSTLQSVRKVKKNFSLVIVDEAHLMDESVQETLRNISYEYVLGLTGTPFLRENIFGEGKFWDDPCATVTIEDLTKLGFLTNLRIGSAVGENVIDLEGIKVQNGDYQASALFDRYKDLIDGQVKEALAKSADRRAVLWVCVNIEHAEVVNGLIGKDSRVIHSKRNDTEKSIRDFKQGKFKHLVSVSQISTGFDAPIADCLVLMRPTKSPALFVQTVGRILRLDEGKEDALLLDYGRVVENLGHPYGITSVNSAKRKMKMCSVCGEFNETDAKVCSCCQSPFYILCDVCLKIKPYGSSCCTVKRTSDPLKQLTQKAFSREEWNDVNNVSQSDYISKRGTKCIKVTYYYGLFNQVHEYLTFDHPYAKAKADRRLKQLQNGRPKRMKIDFTGKYPQVVELVF